MTGKGARPALMFIVACVPLGHPGAGCPVDPFDLYSEVAKYGGFLATGRKRKWQDVGRAVGVSKVRATAAGYEDVTGEGP